MTVSAVDLDVRHGAPAPNGSKRRSADSTASYAVWPRPQIDASRMHLPDLVEERELTLRVAAVRESHERLLLADGADAARHALPAALVAEEAGDAHEQRAQVDGVVERQDHARAERRADRPRAFERERSVERLRADEPARDAAEEHRLQTAGAADAAREIDDLARASARTRTSYTPGRPTWPDTQNSFVPVDVPEPVRANASPPSSTIGSTFTRVSTLLATVGCPKRPTSTGNGGLLRGSPR